MTLLSRYDIVKGIDDETLQRVKSHVMGDLMTDLSVHIEMDKLYSIKFRDDNYSYIDELESESEIEHRKMAVTFDAIPECKVKIYTAEELFLREERSLFGKLKNCWLYLKDKTGGEVRRED